MGSSDPPSPVSPRPLGTRVWPVPMALASLQVPPTSTSKLSRPANLLEQMSPLSTFQPVIHSHSNYLHASFEFTSPSSKA